MSLTTRLKRLEIKLLPKSHGRYWLMWRNCQWKECEELVRSPKESINDFKKRVLLTTDKQFIWVK